jgi:hypothetical protein
MHFKLQPLVRAVCIVIDESVANATKQNVRLISTGSTVGLSEPISFERLGHDVTRRKSGSWQVVTTSLREAIEFVRELGGVIQINNRARKDDYTGGISTDSLVPGSPGSKLYSGNFGHQSHYMGPQAMPKENGRYTWSAL